MTEETGVIEYGEYPEVYADASEVKVLGHNAHIVLTRWRRVGGVYRRCIVGEVIQPIAVMHQDLPVWQMALLQASGQRANLPLLQ